MLLQVFSLFFVPYRVPENIDRKSQGKIMCFYRRYTDSDLCMFYAIAEREWDEAELKLNIKNN